MKHSWAHAGMVVIVTVGLCQGMFAEDGVFQEVQRRANRIAVSKGLAAVGIGSSTDPAMAQKKASERARTAMDHIIQTRANALIKEFQKETEISEIGDYKTLFSDMGKQISAQTMEGEEPGEEFVSEQKGDIITVYALIRQNPRVIKELLASPENAKTDLYERFRASQAFAKLEKDIQQFEDFVKRDGYTPEK